MLLVNIEQLDDVFNWNAQTHKEGLNANFSNFNSREKFSLHIISPVFLSCF